MVINNNIPETFPLFCGLKKEVRKSAMCFVIEEYLFSFVPIRIKPSNIKDGRLRDKCLLSNRFTRYIKVFFKTFLTLA